MKIDINWFDFRKKKKERKTSKIKKYNKYISADKKRAEGIVLYIIVL